MTGAGQQMKTRTAYSILIVASADSPLLGVLGFMAFFRVPDAMSTCYIDAKLRRLNNTAFSMDMVLIYGHG